MIEVIKAFLAVIGALSVLSTIAGVSWLSYRIAADRRRALKNITPKELDEIWRKQNAPRE